MRSPRPSGDAAHHGSGGADDPDDPDDPDDDADDDADDDRDDTDDDRDDTDDDLDDLDDPDGHGDAADVPPARRGRPVSWTDRLILAFVVLVSMVAAWFIAASALPRWWAQRVADVADGGLVIGIFAGLTCGVVFTAGPLVLLRRVVRRRTRWAARWVWLVLAALLATPNLTTLRIASGGDRSARTGSQILDGGAPGFAGATLAGAVLGLVAVLAVRVALASRRRRARELRELRAELRRRERREREDAGGGDEADGLAVAEGDDEGLPGDRP